MGFVAETKAGSFRRLMDRSHRSLAAFASSLIAARATGVLRSSSRAVATLFLAAEMVFRMVASSVGSLVGMVDFESAIVCSRSTVA